VTLNQPAQIVVNSTVVDDDGTGTGAVFLTISGGASPYSASWSNGETGTAVSGLDAGDYEVTVTDANDCFEVVTITVGGSTAIGDPSRPSLKVFPNPSNGIFRAEGAGPMEDLTVNDMLGRRIGVEVMDNDGMLRILEPVPGIYLLQWKTVEDVVSVRLVVE
jgi:hypothetical protein